MTPSLTRRSLKPYLSSLLRAAVFMAVWVLTPCAQAELSFNDGRTRLILDGSKQRWPVNIINQGDEPALMQLSLNWGDKKDTRSLPLAISNPLLLDLLKLPEASDGQTDQLQIAPLHHFKVFYRPPLKSDPAKVAAQVTWRLLAEQGSPKALLANPSPYHVTFTDIEPLDARHQPCAPPTIHLMLAPFSEQPLALDCKQPPASVDYQVISDSGSPKEQRARLSTSSSYGEAKQ